MMRMPVKSSRRRAVFGVSVLLGVLAACSAESIKPIALPAGKAILSKPPRTDDARPEPTATASAPVVEATPTDVTYNIVDLTAADRKRKSAEQLRSSIILCLGAESQSAPAAGGSQSPANLDATLENPAILRVSADMITSDGAAALTEGRVRFLLQDTATSKVNQNIISLERVYLDAISTGTTGTNADSLEDVVYLNSLLTVASVAAFNCDVRAASNTNCNCSTRDAATAMLQRCLPLFDPSSASFRDAVERLSSTENCGAPETAAGLMNRRRAIASLISSYAFATAR